MLIIVGIWIAVSPIVFGEPATLLFVSNVLVGAALIIIAFRSFFLERDAWWSSAKIKNPVGEDDSKQEISESVEINRAVSASEVMTAEREDPLEMTPSEIYHLEDIKTDIPQRKVTKRKTKKQTGQAEN